MKKILNIVKTVLVWLLILLSVAMMIFTVVSVNTFDRNDRDIFGYKAYIVLSDSMSSVGGDKSQGYFNAGDLVIIRETDPQELAEGDIISYISTNSENRGKTVTHMIRSFTTDESGNPGFITYGTATGADDANVVTYPYVLGKYEGVHIPHVGTFFQFLKTTPGYILCILIPFVLLIGMQGFNSIRLFKKYKQEQLAAIEEARRAEREELDAERAAIAEERRRQEELMQELLEFKRSIDENARNSAIQTEEASAQSKDSPSKK